MRTATIQRDTRETQIELQLNLDGTGKVSIATGCGFMDHMLELFARHGDLDLTVKCTGDTYVDYHHSVEDIGICLGKAFTEALGDKRGINRYGQFLLPMDETLVLCAVDLSGRQGILAGLRAQLPRIPPHPPDGGREHPPHSGGGVQGRGPHPEGGRGLRPQASERYSEYQGYSVRNELIP